MKFSIYLLLSLFLILSGCQQQPTEKIAEDLKVGVSVSDMTPPIGYPVHKVTSDGVLDPLEIKAMVFEQGDFKGALVIADLFYIPLELSELVRKLAAEKTGIPVSNICLAATHTHADPTCYHEIEEYVSKITSNKSIKKDECAYAEQLIQRIVNAVVEAQTKLKPVVLKSGTVQVDGLSFNRRHLMKDGTVRMNGGFLNPDIVRTVGPVDNELGILLFEDKQDEKAFASFTTFAMQLATIENNTKFSSDFPHFFEQELQKHFGNEFLLLFGEGPCADVNHWDITKPGPQTGYEEVTYPIGKKLASEFLQEMPDLKRTNETFKVGSKVVNVPLQTYSNMDLEWAVSHKDSIASGIVQVRINKILSLQKLREKHGDTLPLEIQAFVLNEETAIVALPGQIFVELGLALKKDSPFKNTLIITLANSHEECIPLRKAFPEGSYEIVYSLVDSGGGELLIGEALSLLEKMKSNM
ncbi:MAG: neutral/alkaline non-lysosomal ceramidase N-terminal domain-containing protein [Fermentimonas sp.]